MPSSARANWARCAPAVPSSDDGAGASRVEHGSHWGCRTGQSIWSADLARPSGLTWVECGRYGSCSDRPQRAETETEIRHFAPLSTGTLKPSEIVLDCLSVWERDVYRRSQGPEGRDVEARQP